MTDFHVPESMMKPRQILDDERRFVFVNMDDDYEHVRLYYFDPEDLGQVFYGIFLRNEIYDMPIDLLPIPWEPGKTYVKETFKFEKGR